MIASRRNTILQQKCIHTVHVLFCGTVDDSTLILMPFHIIYDTIVRLFPTLAVDHTEEQIWAVKSCHNCHRILQMQTCDNILLNALCGGRGKCTDNRTVWQFRKEICDLKIARPEILPPLGNTVCLIHRNHGNVRIICKVQKARSVEPLRCHINNFVFSLRCIGKCRAYLIFCQGTVDVGRVYACLIQCLDLIRHERNQRGDHKRNSLEHQRRDLITQRFSRTCRHDAKDILSLQDSGHQFLLAGPQAVVSKIMF